MIAVGLPALLLSVASGVLYSAADYFRKAAPADCAPESILFFYICGHIPVLGVWVLWSGAAAVAPGYLLPGLGAAAVGLGANLLFIVAIRRSELSLMVPLLALVPVLALILGGLALGEWPTPVQAFGIVLIAGGLFALFQPAGAKPGARAALATLAGQRGTAPMLAVVALWSAAPALDKLCLAHTTAAMHGLIQVGLIAAALLAWGLARGPRRLRLPAGAVRPVAGSAATGACAYACQLLAYTLAMAAVVEVLKRTVGLLGSLVLGRTAFREPLTGMKAAGIGIITTGLPLVTIG
jgi:drug/metabolite transporter (DMT)-like permease